MEDEEQGDFKDDIEVPNSEARKRKGGVRGVSCEEGRKGRVTCLVGAS